MYQFSYDYKNVKKIKEITPNNEANLSGFSEKAVKPFIHSPINLFKLYPEVPLSFLMIYFNICNISSYSEHQAVYKKDTHFYLTISSAISRRRNTQLFKSISLGLPIKYVDIAMLSLLPILLNHECFLLVYLADTRS